VSAFVVSRKHIAYLVEAATSVRLANGGHDRSLYWYHNGGSHNLRCLEPERSAEVGQMLWDENIKSICARYPDCVGHPDRMPGPLNETFRYERHIHLPMSIDPVQVIKACNCYEYQSCEHEGWTTSEAKTFIDALRRKAINALPGYDDADWEIC
jgi:hypothetical protein